MQITNDLYVHAIEKCYEIYNFTKKETSNNKDGNHKNSSDISDSFSAIFSSVLGNRPIK